MRGGFFLALPKDYRVLQLGDEQNCYQNNDGGNDE
jgi:hypothetical protein